MFGIRSPPSTPTPPSQALQMQFPQSVPSQQIMQPQQMMQPQQILQPQQVGYIQQPLQQLIGYIHQPQPQIVSKPPTKKNTRTGVCKICTKALVNTAIINCHNCDASFHQSCTGVTEEFYQYFVVAEGCPWYCHLCEMKMLQNSNYMSTNIEIAKTEIHKAVDQQFQTLSATIYTNKQEMDFKLTKLEQSVMKEIHTVKSSISTTSDTSTQERLNFLEAQLKKKNLIVNGVPMTTNEDLHEIISKIGIACNSTIRPSAIEEIIRLNPRTRPGKASTSTSSTPAILVKFFSEATKSALFDGYLDLIKRQQFLKCDSLGLETTQRIYINHHQSPALRKLYEKALQLKKNGVIQAVNTRGHTAGIKFNDKWYTVSSEHQLEQLIVKTRKEN
jgi:hypothetical protein